MTVKDIQTEIIKKSEIIAKEISKGNDIDITKTANGLKVMVSSKKTIK